MVIRGRYSPEVTHGDLDGLADNDHTQYVNAVEDTATVDLTLTGQSIKGDVIVGGIDHGGLAGLGDDDHPQYIKDSEFTQDSGFLVGTGAGTFQEETGATLRTSIGVGTGDNLTLTGLTLSGLTAGRVLFAGVGGVISDDAGLVYASGMGILTAGTFDATDKDNILQIGGSTILRVGTITNNNIFIGISTFEQTEGLANVGIGYRTGFNNDDSGGGVKGDRNVYIGYRSGYGNTGGGNNNEGFQNVGVGYDTLFLNTTGRNNLAFGFYALRSNTTGIGNSASGAEALRLNTSGINNVGFGVSALYSNTSGNNNIGVGVFAGYYNQIGNNNTILGVLAGGFGSGGANSFSNCIYIGYQAGYNQATNSNLLIIDNQDRGSAAAEITDCLIYGVFDATPASQSLRFNVGTTTWHNATHEDSDGGRLSQLNFKGEQSGGEETTLARIEVGHDGSADDEKGYIDGYTNSGSDGDTPTKQIRIQSTGDWVINKTSGIGIKVDLSAPTFGWRDLLGQIRTRGVGATDPNDATYIGNIKAYQFAVNDECWVDYHIPHDYVPGTDIFLHFHWSHIGTFVTGGTVTWGADITYAKGHNQAAFSATVNTTIVGNASTTQYQHIITEIQVSVSGGDANKIDTDNLEPDGVIMIRGYLSANNITVSEGAIPDPFLHFKDIHYQSTNLATKQKAPDFYT